MLSEQEFAALAAVLQRAPMTAGEVIALNQIIAKLQPKPAEAPSPPVSGG